MEHADAEARSLVHNIWARLAGSYSIIPIDPTAIANDLGLQVYTVEFPEPDLAGMLYKAPQQDPIIYVEQTDNRRRQRFTIAHELGHYIYKSRLGQLEDEYGFVDRRDDIASAAIDYDEIWANRFAAELLMPGEAVRALYGIGDTSASELAARFDVSTTAMGFRLKNLRLA